VATLNAAGPAIERDIGAQSLNAPGLEVRYDGASQTLTVSGLAADQATKEKIVRCRRNVSPGVKVKDLLTVAGGGGPESTSREVKAADTLSNTAQETYGNANGQMKFFEANKPMLFSDPNKIYPGQKLRISPQ
jgi:nucleoid-associated protein YgaU